jgi:hypothetical protein
MQGRALNGKFDEAKKKAAPPALPPLPGSARTGRPKIRTRNELQQLPGQGWSFETVFSRSRAIKLISEEICVPAYNRKNPNMLLRKPASNAQ